MSIKIARVPSWDWPGMRAKYGQWGAWWHYQRRGFTLRWRDRLLLIGW